MSNDDNAAGSQGGNGLTDLANDPRYQQLIRRRGRFSWLLSFIMLAIYFGYVLVIAFRRDILARPIADGVTTLGIPVGIAVILSGIALTGIYVLRMNRTFDPEMRDLLREYGA
jgi:uncharacterized membrane protein (DUF485 family)